jgi:hypothetical protein
MICIRHHYTHIKYHPRIIELRIVMHERRECTPGPMWLTLSVFRITYVDLGGATALGHGGAEVVGA